MPAPNRYVMVDGPDGPELLDRERLRSEVRAELTGLDLVGELVAERRAEAAADDAD